MTLTNDLFATVSGQITYEPASPDGPAKRSCPMQGIIAYPIGGVECIVTVESRPLSSGGYQLTARRADDGTVVVWKRFVAGELEPVLKPVWEPDYSGLPVAEACIRWNETHERLLISFPQTVDGAWEDTVFTHDAQTGFLLGQGSLGVPTRYGWTECLGVNEDVICKTWRVSQVDSEIKGWRWDPANGSITELWSLDPATITTKEIVLDCHGRKIAIATETQYEENPETGEEVEVEVFSHIETQPYKTAIQPPYDYKTDSIRAVFSSYDEDYKSLHTCIAAIKVEDGAVLWKFEQSFDVAPGELQYDPVSLAAAATEAAAVTAIANATQSPPFNEYEGGFEPYVGFNDIFPKISFDYWPPKPGSGAWLPAGVPFTNFDSLDPENPIENGNHKLQYLTHAGAQQEDVEPATEWEVRVMPHSSEFGDPDEELFLGVVADQTEMLDQDSENPPDNGSWVRVENESGQVYEYLGGDPTHPGNWVKSGDGVIDRSYTSSIIHGLPGAAITDPNWGIEPLRWQPHEGNSGNYPDSAVQEYDEESEEDPPPIHHNGCLCVDRNGDTYAVVMRVKMQIVWSGRIYRARRLNGERPLDVDACINGRHPFGDGIALGTRVWDGNNHVALVTGENYPCAPGDGLIATHPATPMETIEQFPPNSPGSLRTYVTIEDCLADVGWEPATWSYEADGETLTAHEDVHALISAPEYSYHRGDPLNANPAPPGGGPTPWWHFRYFYSPGNPESSFWAPVESSCRVPWVAVTPEGRYAWNPLPPYGFVELNGPLADCRPNGSPTKKPYGSPIPYGGYDHANRDYFKVVMPGSSAPPSLDYRIVAEPQLIRSYQMFLQKVRAGSLVWEADLSEEYENQWGTKLYKSGVVRLVLPSETGGVFVVRDKAGQPGEISLGSQGFVEYRSATTGAPLFDPIPISLSDRIQAYVSETAVSGQPWLLVVGAGVAPVVIDHEGNTKTMSSPFEERPTTEGVLAQVLVNGRWIFLAKEGGSWRLRVVHDPPTP